jgi:integrase
MLGKKPLSSNSAQRDYLRPASIEAGLQPIGWHALRHSYRTWLDEMGTSIMVQKELMRHSTIAMTMVVQFQKRIGRRIPGWSAICCSSEIRYWTVNGLWRLVTD